MYKPRDPKSFFEWSNFIKHTIYIRPTSQSSITAPKRLLCITVCIPLHAINQFLHRLNSLPRFVGAIFAYVSFPFGAWSTTYLLNPCAPSLEIRRQSQRELRSTDNPRGLEKHVPRGQGLKACQENIPTLHGDERELIEVHEL